MVFYWGSFVVEEGIQWFVEIGKDGGNLQC